MKKQDQSVSAGNNGGTSAEPTLRAGLWPAVLIVFVEISLMLGISPYASTIFHNIAIFMVVPLVATLLLAGWWLLASKAPWRDRLMGVALFAVSMLLVLFMQRPLMNGALLLIYALPALPALAVAALAVTFWLRWPVQRWIAAAIMLLGAGGFALFRVEGLGGAFLPVLSFRWSPVSEVRSSEWPPLAEAGTASLPTEPGPGDWPGFRGPSRDNHVTGTVFSTDWSTPPQQVWRQRIGLGWSSFTVIGGYVFTQEQRDEWELVTCYRLDTGENVWANRIETRHEDPMGSGPRATPLFDRGNLYTVGATGILQCLDAATGNTLWRKDLREDFNVKFPNWGFSGSPLALGSLIIVGTGGSDEKSLIALQGATGEIVWSAGNASNGYSSPHFARLAGVPQILMLNDDGLKSIDPETGGMLWEHIWKVSTNPRCVQPLLVGDNSVMMGTAGTLGSRLLRVARQDTGWNIEEEWSTRRFRPYFNDAVMHKGNCYGFDGDRLACIDLETGGRVWEGKRYGGQLLLIVEMDLLLVLSEKGEVALVEATPERFNEVALFQALSGKTWNHPVVAHGKLLVRNAEEVACFALPGSTSL